jgi:LacI family transcriptional regulator
MMKRRITATRRLVVRPLGVVTRRSSDILAHQDPDIRAALRFIHDHACDGIAIPDVVDHVLVARRALEIRFRAATGRTLRQEIERVRLDRAQRLLLETDLAIERVASTAGFTSESYLAQVFRKQRGTTPAAYRRAHRASGGPVETPPPVDPARVKTPKSVNDPPGASV